MKPILLMLLTVAVIASVAAYATLYFRPDGQTKRTRSLSTPHLFNWGEGAHSN